MSDDAAPASSASQEEVTKEIEEIEHRVTFYNDSDTAVMSMYDFTRLIEIARKGVAVGRAAERERCAEIAEREYRRRIGDEWADVAINIAAAIRAASAEPQEK